MKRIAKTLANGWLQLDQLRSAGGAAAGLVDRGRYGPHLQRPVPDPADQFLGGVLVGQVRVRPVSMRSGGRITGVRSFITPESQVAWWVMIAADHSHRSTQRALFENNLPDVEHALQAPVRR